jgi:hypothetical protein
MISYHQCFDSLLSVLLLPQKLTLTSNGNPGNLMQIKRALANYQEEKYSSLALE